MTWQRKRLSDVAELCLGKMLDQKKNKGELRPYLANLNVRWGSIDLEGLREMRFEDRELDRYGLREGDIVMCEGGEPGRCALWSGQVPGMMIQKALHRIRPNNGVDSRFLFYSLFHQGRAGEFDRYFTGATIKHLPGEQLAKVEVDLPAIETQQRIAAILGAYDDLIEVNRRRVAVLEEMARGLFEEWFVRFRFPGREAVPILDTPDGPLPEGWRWENLYDAAEVAFGFAFKSKAFTTERVGVPVVRIRDVQEGRTSTWTPEPFDDRYCVRNGDLLIGMDGIFHTNIWVGGDAALNQRVTRLRPKDGLSVGWLFQGVLPKIKFFEATISGTTVAHLGAKHLKTIVLPRADEATQRRADAFFAPIDAELVNLKVANEKLAASRDLLLPRLISGQLSVEAAERELEAAA